ncbi:5-(carboxyamino)imidazole ribonucleotide mutase [Stecheria intestinalis]|uniref:5-(carboxyamino)imidazole ribonucleotide mutase n=1 Tax=Stecheria intestinalis TaxID=2606630 RepID=UPI0023F2E618|nr:5-(carboxyamino)imidazole ribonucleotide mutase [Stecheria intestinalis]MDD5881665.1 5-(carboxyamino)imidazole ribonucleotide mutase [Stecheria intestinalis]
MKKAAVIMGSDSDFPVMSKAMKTLKDLGIPFEAHVMSAHRTPEETAKFAKNAEENGFGVLIAGAGMSAALAGSLAANTTLPVIGVPLRGGAMDGLDALLSTSMMPSGIPVACVAIDGAKNAAYLAAEILALSDPALAHRLKEERASMDASVEQKDRALQEKVREL